MGGRWMKAMKGNEDLTLRMLGAAEPILKEAWVRRMVMEKGGSSPKMRAFQAQPWR